MEYVSFLFHAGYTERAIRILEYLCKVHFKGISPSQWLCSNGALNYPSEAVDVLVSSSSLSSERDAIVEWLNIESYRSFKFAITVDDTNYAVDEPEEDADRIVHFED